MTKVEKAVGCAVVLFVLFMVSQVILGYLLSGPH